MKLIFEKYMPGTGINVLPACDVPAAKPSDSAKRQDTLHLPQLAEGEISRHYSELERRTFGVNNGFYPLGSCTMKYNPKLNDEMAGLAGFTEIHPLQPEDTVQGCLAVLKTAGNLLCEITGMDAMTFQPAAGAHGEYTGIAMMKAYHEKRGEGAQRIKMLVPDAAHGTNPASAAMNGYTVVTIPSDNRGNVDINALKAAIGPDVAGLMLTNPNTVGMLDRNIKAITELVHGCGGLCYYDGANLNAVMGVIRPGEMGFDVIHLNLHKTFSTPHGGGGPGSGAVGCKECLRPFLPAAGAVHGDDAVSLGENKTDSIGKVKSFYGNFLVVVRALTYILSLGKEGIPQASKSAVLNANYLMRKMVEGGLGKYLVYDEICMHEFVLSMTALKAETGVSALDLAKAMLDNGMHPPTMYFPLIVDEALMFEPTETETRETLDWAAGIVCKLVEQAKADPDYMHTAPHHTVVGRPDDVTAARNPIVKYGFCE